MIQLIQGRDGAYFSGCSMRLRIQDHLKNIKGKVTLIFRNEKTGDIRIYVYNNMFVTFGHNAIAQRMAGNSSAGEITYCAVGTGTTAPAMADTALETELARKLITVREYSDNIFTGTIYFNTSEAVGTLREAGLFGNGVGRTASTIPGSGQLYTRVAINRTKSANDSLTIQWAITIGA